MYATQQINFCALAQSFLAAALALPDAANCRKMPWRLIQYFPLQKLGLCLCLLIFYLSTKDEVWAQSRWLILKTHRSQWFFVFARPLHAFVLPQHWLAESWVSQLIIGCAFLHWSAWCFQCNIHCLCQGQAHSQRTVFRRKLRRSRTTKQNQPFAPPTTSLLKQGS